MTWAEDDYLQLSGLQHFVFCRRQWALIHVEGLWAENYRTTDGAIMHKNAHDPDYVESRGDRLITRAVRVYSASLGVSGECDVVEYFRSPDGVPLSGREGLWWPFPVEYKRGRPGAHTDADAMQLCAQALCLEEMLCCPIPGGALYYGETRRREEIKFTDELRRRVRASLEEMHALMQRGYTPTVKPKGVCRACSLRELCLPKMLRAKSAGEFLRQRMEE